MHRERWVILPIVVAGMMGTLGSAPLVSQEQERPAEPLIRHQRGQPRERGRYASGPCVEDR